MKKCTEKNKVPHTRTSFTLTEEMKNQISQIANDKNIPVAKLVRIMIEKGMNEAKTRRDLEFLRAQLQEELEASLKKYEKEMGNIIADIALYIVPQCKFTADVVQMLLYKEQGIHFEDMMEQAQKETLVLLSEYGNPEDIEAYNRYQ